MPRRLEDVGEWAMVRRLVKLAGSAAATPVMDDCAVIRAGGKSLVLTTDILNAYTHFPRGTSARLAGWHSAAVTFSDVASMGARPLGLLMALSMPRKTDASFVEEMTRGARECANACGSHVVGGDTKEGKVFVVCTSALGIVEKGKPLLRSGARPGDLLCHTGEIGRAALWQLRRGRENAEKMLLFPPRIWEGMILQEAGATSCIDLSDGLALSIHYLAENSGAGFEVDFDAIGFHPELTGGERTQAVSLGGDYELLFTLPENAVGKVGKALDRIGTRMSVIGKATRKGVRMKVNGRMMNLPKQGYEHFRG